MLCFIVVGELAYGVLGYVHPVHHGIADSQDELGSVCYPMVWDKTRGVH